LVDFAADSNKTAVIFDNTVGRGQPEAGAPLLLLDGEKKEFSISGRKRAFF